MVRAVLVCLSLTLPALALAQSATPLDPLLPLLNSKAVQKELKLDAEQIAAVDKTPPKIVEQFKTERDKLDDEFAKLEKESTAFVDQVDNELIGEVGKLLTTEQAARLRQVRLHQLGVWAFVDSQVRKELDLTGKQLDAIGKAQDEFQEELLALPDKVTREAKGDAKEYARLMHKEQLALLGATMDRILQVLEAEQQKKWKRLVGPDLSLRLPLQASGSSLVSVTTTGQLFTDLAAITRAELKMGEDAVRAIAVAQLVMVRKHLDTWDKLQAQLYTLSQRDLELQGKMFEAFRALVRKDILKPTQWHRLQQLEVQIQGLEALVGPASKSLALSKQQKRKILDLRQECARVGRNILNEPEAQNPRWLQRKLQEESRRAAKEMDKILDGTQRILWIQEVGAPFDFTDIVEFVPLSPPPLWVMPADQETLTRANMMIAKQEYKLAAEALEEGMELNNKSPWACNSLAFLLATCKDDKVRDGKRAIELATKAMLLQPDEGEFMDTLAAANAEIGQFERAIMWERKAIEKGRPVRKAAYEARLKIYENKKPYRE